MTAIGMATMAATGPYCAALLHSSLWHLSQTFPLTLLNKHSLSDSFSLFTQNLAIILSLVGAEKRKQEEKNEI